jgi:hypothetical protein
VCRRVHADEDVQPPLHNPGEQYQCPPSSDFMANKKKGSCAL